MSQKNKITWKWDPPKEYILENPHQKWFKSDRTQGPNMLLIRPKLLRKSRSIKELLHKPRSPLPKRATLRENSIKISSFSLLGHFSAPWTTTSRRSLSLTKSSSTSKATSWASASCLSNLSIRFNLVYCPHCKWSRRPDIWRLSNKSCLSIVSSPVKMSPRVCH